jgi:tetratricopeptide (TPR) repeat protein
METALFSEIRPAIKRELLAATNSIRAAIAWFTNHELFDVLCDKAAAGLRVELIVLNDGINNWERGLDFQRFINMGGHFYYSSPENPMHHKFCIIDNHTLINGSYNWTYWAESRNIENVIIHKNKPELIASFSEEFEQVKGRWGRVEEVEKYSIEFAIQYFDYFSVSQFLAHDTYHQAMELKQRHRSEEALYWVGVSINLDAKNNTFREAYNQLRNQVEAEISEKQRVQEKKLAEKAQKEEDARTAIKWLEKGQLEYNLKKYGDAEVSANNALSYAVNKGDALRLMSIIKWRMKDCDAQIDFAQQSLDYEGAHDLSYCSLGNAFFDKGNYEEALKYYRKSLTSHSKDHVIYWNIALVYERMGDTVNYKDQLSKTVDASTKYISENPQNLRSIVVAHALRGEAYRLLEQKEIAYSDFSRAKAIFLTLPEEEKDYHDLDRIEEGLKKTSADMFI